MFEKPDQLRRSTNMVQAMYIAEEKWQRDWLDARWPHILEPEREHLNLPLAAARAVGDWEERHGSSFPWHYWRGIKSSRNLHSSQVLGLTLFGAFAGSRRCLLERALLSAEFLMPGETIHESEFEYEPPNFFNEPRRTSVDLFMRVGRERHVGTPIYFEVKFLESSFGRCSRRSSRQCLGFPSLSIRDIPAACLFTKEGIQYWESLTTLVDSEVDQTGCPIQGPFYQLARNVLHLVREGGRAFVVLFDARAKYLDDEITRFIDFLTPPYRGLVRRMTFQQLIPHLGHADSAIVELMRRKYGIQF